MNVLGSLKQVTAIQIQIKNLFNTLQETIKMQI